MKRELLVICALSLALCAKAQNETVQPRCSSECQCGLTIRAKAPNVTNSDAEETKKEKPQTEVLGANGAKSGFSLNYQAIDGGFGMGLSMILNHVVIDMGMQFGDTDYFDTNEGWNVGIGGNYRYWFTKSLFIEGTAGVQYRHWKVGMDGEEESNGDFGLFVTPKIGLTLFRINDADWGIQAGYRWDFNKFKFSKEYTSDFFTIGIVGTL